MGDSIVASLSRAITAALGNILKTDPGVPGGIAVPTGFALSTSSLAICPYNPLATRRSFQNQDAAITVWLTYGTDPTAVPTAVAGAGSWQMLPGAILTFEGVVAQNPFSAIAASGTPNLHFMEIS